MRAWFFAKYNIQLGDELTIYYQCDVSYSRSYTKFIESPSKCKKNAPKFIKSKNEGNIKKTTPGCLDASSEDKTKTGHGFLEISTGINKKIVHEFIKHQTKGETKNT